MKERSARNKTLTLTADERERLSASLTSLTGSALTADVTDRIFCQDLMSALPLLPQGFADLLIIDPPYNLSIQFGDLKTRKSSDEAYLEYVLSWLPQTLRLLKPTGSVYICCDWQSSPVIYSALKQCGIHVRNRITWQREKGRGSKSNWKNSMEDIWYGTVDAKQFYFDVDAVKQKRRVIAPYHTENGQPKDWEETDEGKFRLTCPSNFWDDISIPYWSMPENTDHPTQKPEKLLAKLILASCPEGGIVADPFIGSGSTAVTARKLDRHFFGIELNPEYVLWALKRLEKAKSDKHIQGYEDHVFWERNSGK
ncbi:MAG: site-specific DNA-methyltransferase [Bacteroidales bacterium]|nr:site-specific DNA-methyltransferase [Bacteroidales bacterium]